MSLQGQGNFPRLNDSAAGDLHAGDYANVASLLTFTARVVGWLRVLHVVTHNKTM